MADKQISDLTAATGLTDGSLFVIEQSGAAKSANWGMMKEYISPDIAPQYSASSTYAVGEYVIYNGSLYRCKTAITTAESWTASHWEIASIGNSLFSVICDERQDSYIVNTGDDYNLFFFDSALKGVDLDGNTGRIIPNASYMVSSAIIVDCTKRILVRNCTPTPYLYCYDVNGTFLGRYNGNATSSPISSTYPATAFIRVVGAITDTDLTVLYEVRGFALKEYNPVAGWIDKSRHVAAIDNSCLKESYYGNLYNPNEACPSRDIVGNTGTLIEDSRYITSGKIYADFTKRVVTKNDTYTWIYCYGPNETYLGRYRCTDDSGSVYSHYANTEYIRIIAKATDENVMLVYDKKFLPDVFTPYSGIRKSFEDCVTNDPINIRIGSYNMGDFTGTGLTTGADSTAETYRKAIGKIGSDICGFQFDVRTFGNHGDAFDYIVTQKRWKEWHGNNDRNYDYFGVGSDFVLANEGRVMYANAGGYNLTHTWFEVFDLFYHGKAVHFINLHLEWQDNTMRAQQITEVLADAANYTNVIIMGDFNPEDRTNGEWNGSPNTLTYEADLARFKSAGFTPGNAGPFGVFNTIGDGQLNGPWDNILTKGSIVIKQFGTVVESYMNDHYPVWADITIW